MPLGFFLLKILTAIFKSPCIVFKSRRIQISFGVVVVCVCVCVCLDLCVCVFLKILTAKGIFSLPFLRKIKTNNLKKLLRFQIEKSCHHSQVQCILSVTAAVFQGVEEMTGSSV